MAFNPNIPAQGNNARSDLAAIKDNFNALRENEKGASAPSNLVAGMLWVDTAAHQLKIRNEANTAWQVVWDFANSRVPDGIIVTPSFNAAAVAPNADKTDGYHASATPSANIIPVTGGDGKLATGFIPTLPSATVGQSQLKTSTGTVTRSDLAGGGYYTLPGGQYAFVPQFSGLTPNSGSVDNTIKGSVSASSGDLPNYTWAQVTQVYLEIGNADASPYITAHSRYVTASGTEHWAFALKNKDTGLILSLWEAPDHPTFGNESTPDELPHPFVDYLNKELPENLEIVLLDMDSINLAKTIAGERNKKLHRVIMEDLEIDPMKKLIYEARDMNGKEMLRQLDASLTVRKAVLKR